MTNTPGLDADRLVAIDVHVHLEHQGELSAADEGARKYFGQSGASYDWKALAEYYRSRRIGCVVFTVDEKLTGRPQVSNDAVAEFAAEHADIAIAFASIDPARGAEGVREARRLIASGGIHGLKLHPPIQQFFPNDRLAHTRSTKCSPRRGCRSSSTPATAESGPACRAAAASG